MTYGKIASDIKENLDYFTNVLRTWIHGGWQIYANSGRFPWIF